MTVIWGLENICYGDVKHFFSVFSSGLYRAMKGFGKVEEF